MHRAYHSRQHGFHRWRPVHAAGVCGFALEVGEGVPFADFRKAVAGRGRLGVSRLAEGEVTLTGSAGGTLRVRANPKTDLPLVAADGTEVGWARRADVYRGPVIEQGWMSGRLRVAAGGWAFESSVGEGGESRFREVPAGK